MAEKYLNDSDICELLRCAKEQESEEKLEAAIGKVNALLKRFLQVAKLHGKRFNEKLVYSASEKLIGHCRTLQQEPHRKYEMSAAIDDALRVLTIALLNVEGTEGGGSRILMQVRKDDPPQELERLKNFVSPRSSESGVPQQSIVSPQKQPPSPRGGAITNAPAPISNTNISNTGNHNGTGAQGASETGGADADAKPKKPRKPRRKLAFADDDDAPKKEEHSPAPAADIAKPELPKVETSANPESASADIPKESTAKPAEAVKEAEQSKATTAEAPTPLPEAAVVTKPTEQHAPAPSCAEQAILASPPAATPAEQPAPVAPPAEEKNASPPAASATTPSEQAAPAAPVATPAEEKSPSVPTEQKSAPTAASLPLPGAASVAAASAISAGAVASAIASLSSSSGSSSASARLNSSDALIENRPRKDSRSTPVITAEAAGRIISLLNISPRRCRTVISVVDQNEVKRIKEAQIATFTAEQKRAFVLVGYNAQGTATLLEGKQNGSAAELRELLRDDQAHFALLRVPLTTAPDSKCKDVFISWIGPKVGLKEKVRVQGHVGAMKIVLAPAHYDIQAVNKTNFTEERVQHLLDPSSGSHVID